MKNAYELCLDIINSTLYKINSDVSMEDIREYLELQKIEVEKSRILSKDKTSEYLDKLVKELH